jgi:hypothetical protein
MGAATATVRSTTGGGVRPGELRVALDRALAASDADDVIGPRIRATGLRMRFDLPDAAIVLYVRAGGDDEPNLVWSFDETPDWQPRLELEMSAEVANRYLQGRESLAIAIARGLVRCRGASRAALAYLPAARLICEPYRRVIAADFPDLVAA